MVTIDSDDLLVAPAERRCASTQGILPLCALDVLEDLPLGVLGMKTWARPEGTEGSAARRKSRPIHEKESIKWIEGLAYLSALKSRCEHTQLIGIGDRESDVYELFAA